MKRLILTTIVCFILCLTIPINSFASGVGGSLGGIGSNIDPRTDSRYKENFELDVNDTSDKYFIDNNFTYGDVVFTYFQNVDSGGEIKQVELKCYFRIWYVLEEFNNPCILWSVDSTGFGNLYLKYQQYGSLKPVAMGWGTELYNGTFDCGHSSKVNGLTSSIYFDNVTQMGKVLYSDFPVFGNLDDVEYYCSTSQVRNALYDSSPRDYLSELYFKSFEVIPHVSNIAKFYYFDIKYELSDFAKKNIDKLNLNFENMYQLEMSAINGAFNSYCDTAWYSKSIPLSDKPFGFTIDLIDLPCYQYAVSADGYNLDSKAILGSKGFIIDTFNDVLQNVVGDITSAAVESSYLYFKFNLRFSGSNGVVVGKRNDFTYDILNNTVEKYIYTPDTSTDSSGNTTFNKDSNGNITYTQEGDKVTSNDYYYNKVTETNEGDTTNVTNNYYYYDKDGKEHEISEDDYNNSSMTVMGGEGGSATAEGGSATANASIGDININISNGSGEYIDISPQSYALYIDAMKTLLEELDPQGGLFLLMHDAYTVFPASIWVIVGGGLAAAVMVSLVCIARRY